MNLIRDLHFYGFNGDFKCLLLIRIHAIQYVSSFAVYKFPDSSNINCDCLKLNKFDSNPEIRFNIRNDPDNIFRGKRPLLNPYFADGHSYQQR